MPKHTVTFNIPERELGRADVQFVVRQDGQVLGTLAVSNGSLVWFPKKTTNGMKMSWSRFDSIMQAESRKVEKR